MDSERGDAEPYPAGQNDGSSPYLNRPSRQSNDEAGYGTATSVPELHAADTCPGGLVPMLGNMVGRSAAMQEVFSLILGIAIAVFCAEHFVANRFYDAEQSPEPRTSDG